VNAPPFDDAAPRPGSSGASVNVPNGSPEFTRLPLGLIVVSGRWRPTPRGRPAAAWVAHTFTTMPAVASDAPGRPEEDRA
jgi:hypothetical protein